MDGIDFVQGGVASGSVAERLVANNFDAGTMRPFIGDDGRSYVQNDNGVISVVNAQATLRKDEWTSFDSAVVAAAKNRLSAWSDLRGAGLSHSIPNGMSKTILEYEDQSDITAADLTMDGIETAGADRPEYTLKTLPLPIVHKDFSFTARQLAASRNGNSPLDTTTAGLAGRKVAEKIEDLLLGNLTFAYGGGTIYGYTNFTSRLTGSLTAPTSANHSVTLNEVLGMRQALYNIFHYGPYMLYVSPAWDQYLDEDFSAAKGGNTFRERLKQIPDIMDVKTLDNMTDTAMVLVQMSPEVVRAVVGMEVQTIQWESHGGMLFNFKVMGIQVPQLRADQNGNSGIAHYSV